jgi:hypothetical protein
MPSASAGASGQETFLTMKLDFEPKDTVMGFGRFRRGFSRSVHSHARWPSPLKKMNAGAANCQGAATLFSR